jgi:APA family basic amino acid/polyamine antiporter
MARDGLLPEWFGAVAPKRRTPVRATVLVTIAIAVLALITPMVTLAQATGYVTLAVFAVVNLSLVNLARRPGWKGSRHLLWWGVAGAVLTLALLGYETWRVATD